MKKRKSKLFPILLVIILVSGLIWFKTNEVQVTEEVPVIKEVRDSKLEAVLNEAEFKRATELRAKKIILDRERKEEIERHQAKIKEIEAGLESLRKEELSEGF